MELKNQTLAYEILDLIDKNGGSMVYTDIVNAFLPDVSPSETDNTLIRMLAEGLISGEIPSTSSITLTPKGEDELYAYRRNLSEEAVKVESPEPQCEKHTNTPTVDTEQKAVKKKIKINWGIVVDVFIALASIAAAIITLIAAKG